MSLVVMVVISVMCLVCCNVRDGVAVAYNDYGFVCNDSGNVALVTLSIMPRDLGL
jgi:hypothetical protein